MLICDRVNCCQFDDWISDLLQSSRVCTNILFANIRNIKKSVLLIYLENHSLTNFNHVNIKDSINISNLNSFTFQKKQNKSYLIKMKFWKFLCIWLYKIYFISLLLALIYLKMLGIISSYFNHHNLLRKTLNYVCMKIFNEI